MTAPASITQPELADALHGLHIIVTDQGREVTAPVRFPVATAAAIFTAAGREAGTADVNDLPVTPAAARLYKLASRWTSEAFRLGQLLDQKHPRAAALEHCSAELRETVNGLCRDGEL